MIEDQLTRQQRIRLEALAQANAAFAAGLAAHQRRTSTDAAAALVEMAQVFEEYITGPVGLSGKVRVATDILAQVQTALNASQDQPTAGRLFELRVALREVAEKIDLFGERERRG